MSDTVSSDYHQTAASHYLEGVVERLKAQVAALTVAVEQADEAKADAEAAAAREEAETDRVMVERDAARAEVERLKAGVLDGRRATNQRIIAERDSALAEVKRLIAERELALAEVKRSKDWLEVAAQVADSVGAKACTDDGKETADKIARRIRAMMQEG